MGNTARNLVAAVGIFLFVGLSASLAAAAGHTPTYSTPATPPLSTAIVDPALFGGSQTATAFARTRAAGATYVRFAVDWSSIAASTPPAGFVATDPTSPGYAWERMDAV